MQAQVLQLLGDIRDKLNLAMLFITHDLRVAAQVCDDVAVMSKGRIVEYGPATQVFGSPGVTPKSTVPSRRIPPKLSPSSGVRFVVTSCWEPG